VSGFSSNPTWAGLIIMLPNFILTYACFESGHTWLTDTMTNLVIGSLCGHQFSVKDMMP